METKEELKQRGCFASRLQEGNLWEKDNECLNLHDINKPPKYYTGTEKQWIEELTTYIFLYPAEWQSIYEQYQALSKEDSDLKYYRNDEGYLRLTKTEKIYLKITGTDKPLSHTVLNHIGQILSEQEEELFYSYLGYADMSDADKKLWIVRWKNEIEKHINREISVTLASTLDDFTEGELYFDLLNNTYIIFLN